MTRSVLVTGGASGIGRATALLLAREGAAVTVVDRAADAADDTAREITSAGGSAIAAVASTAALKGHGYGSGYTASKGGVAALTRLAAVQYGPQGVRVNCICPGGVDTPMTAGTWRTPEAQERIRRIVPLQRVAEPEEIASVAAFLLSDGAAHLTGQTIAVDGGTTIA